MPNIDEFDIHGQWANPNTIECTDCIYRDVETIKLDGKEIPIGATRCFCDMYPEGVEMKPTGITLRGEHCEFFEREE